MDSLGSILKIGKVISVKGRQVEVLVDKTKNTSHLLYNGELIKNVSVGSYVKISKGFQQLVGKIDGEYISEDKTFSSKEYKHERDKNKRILNLSLLGYFDVSIFKQGIKELPLIDNECSLLTQNEFNSVHNFIKIINGTKDDEIKIGKLASEHGVEIKIGVNSLFASHVGIFGNTGSGKSYTLAGLYHNLFKKYGDKQGFKNNARFLFIDFNGEYSEYNCITTEKKVFNLSTRKEIADIRVDDKLPIDESVLADVEILSILADATEKTQKPFISRAISFYNKVLRSDEPLDYFKNTVKRRIKDVMLMSDKEKAYSLVDYLYLIAKQEIEIESIFESVEWNNSNHHFMPKGGPSRALTVKEIEGLELYIEIDDYEFPNDIVSKLIHFLQLQLIWDVYNDKAKNDHIGPAINKLKSKAKSLQKVLNTEVVAGANIFSDKNIVVINLNDANIEIKKTIPLLLSKKTYAEHKLEYRVNNKKYLNIIIDEAHNILSYSSKRESETWKDYRLETFEEIIKEGRKFGVFLTLASQRPSDISSTIISQLHNYFLHRLINNKDIDAVERTISYLDKVSFESLPIMPTGTCVMAGLSAQVPIILEIDQIEEGFEPNSKTIRPTDFWQ
jgi:DNA helicase HerA-like ATPase